MQEGTNRPADGYISGLRDEAIRLGQVGLTFRGVAVYLGQPSGTVYGQFKNPGVGRTRAEWRADVTR